MPSNTVNERHESWAGNSDESVVVVGNDDFLYKVLATDPETSLLPSNKTKDDHQSPYVNKSSYIPLITSI
jgi:hypothetical protein